MRQKSHMQLGQYLMDKFMQDIPARSQQAFLFGCAQPDKNPFTYLKGSIRYQWLRGHNFPNTLPLICRLSQRLERRKEMSLLDYYTLGKLIHYIADAFTHAHNVGFPNDLDAHRQYEYYLQIYFLQYLRNECHMEIFPYNSIMDAFQGYHHLYRCRVPSIYTDARFILAASCFVVQHLMKNNITAAE